jgi:hypothetical protein
VVSRKTAASISLATVCKAAHLIVLEGHCANPSLSPLATAFDPPTQLSAKERETEMKQAILNRYGFGYDARNTAQHPVDAKGNRLYPDARPFYIPANAADDPVKDHGDWCLARAMHPDNEARIRAVMES